MRQVFYERGLGEVVRQIWQAERVNPPADLTNLGVWQWLNRADVAVSLAISLIADTRLLIVAAASMARLVTRFAGGGALESMQRVQLMAYGLEEGHWRASMVALNQQGIEHLQHCGQRVVSGPGGDVQPGKDWLCYALGAAAAVNGAMHIQSEHGPGQAIRQQVYDAQKHAWMGLRLKFRDVDGIPDGTAKHVANQLLLDELRKVINPGCFSSVFLWARRPA